MNEFHNLSSKNFWNMHSKFFQCITHHKKKWNCNRFRMLKWIWLNSIEYLLALKVSIFLGIFGSTVTFKCTMQRVCLLATNVHRPKHSLYTEKKKIGKRLTSVSLHVFYLVNRERKIKKRTTNIWRLHCNTVYSRDWMGSFICFSQHPGK